MVLFGPTETPEMLFEIWQLDENFGRNFDHFQKIERSLKINSSDFIYSWLYRRMKFMF